MKNERKEELKDEMKNRISLALKDPILQQGFEIICKNLADLEQENAEYKEVFGDCSTCKRTCDIGNCCDPRTKSSYLVDKVKVIAERQRLLKENEELKEELKAIDKAGEHVRQQINDVFRNKKSYWELEKENAELKARLNAINLLTPELRKASNLRKQQLTIAKELLKWWVSHCGNHDLHYAKKTEQFLKDSEVEK